MSFRIGRGRLPVMAMGISLVLGTAAAFAQIVQGSFTGYVLDSETHQPVANATVRIEEAQRNCTTASDGSFTIRDMSSGRYSIRVSHPSYAESTVRVLLDESAERRFFIFLERKIYETGVVVVTAERTRTAFEPIAEESTVLRGRELEKELGLTLASTLKNETGLAVRSMGPAPARPVIRGLGGDRVHISEDGYKTTDLSATSPDHAVTIEPFSLERIEVIRGPRVLLYGSTTIGGVIDVIRDEIPRKLSEHVTGSLGAYLETVNRGNLGSLVAEAPLGKAMFRGEFSRRVASDLETPAGTLKNSASDNRTFALGGSWIMPAGYIGASVRDFALSYGVPGGFVGAHPNGVHIDIERSAIHGKAQVENMAGPVPSIEAQVSRSLYRHREYESNGSIGTDFRISDISGSLFLHHVRPPHVARGTLGMSLESRDFEVGGNVFTPSSRSLALAVFAYEEFSCGDFSFEAGGRYGCDRIAPAEEDPSANIGFIRRREFHTWALSFSVLHALSPALTIGANISRSSRVPTIEELYSEGPHLAAYSYEVGNPDLPAESGYGGEAFIHYSSPSLYVLLNGFYNRLGAYLVPRNTGRLNWRLILPIYRTDAVDAQFAGMETELKWNFTRAIAVHASASHTVGRNIATGKPLPAIPPFKGRCELAGSFGRLMLSVSAEWAARQCRVDEFENPTAGYVVLNGSAQYSFITGKHVHAVSITIDNFLNAEYRNHLSRVRSIMPEAGRNLRLCYKIFFEI
ncbi:MAG: TonB-dependent receptor [Bacteroidota bacterium]|nr:TonB-dependent receptor [Bacteroidota bacterium]